MVYTTSYLPYIGYLDISLPLAETLLALLSAVKEKGLSTFTPSSSPDTSQADPPLPLKSLQNLSSTEPSFKAGRVHRRYRIPVFNMLNFRESCPTSVSNAPLSMTFDQ